MEEKSLRGLMERKVGERRGGMGRENGMECGRGETKDDGTETVKKRRKVKEEMKKKK